jgi:uncharacterized protein (DUF1330 family)
MMLTRIRPGRVIDLARRDVPAPVDVVNLITTARFDRYRWYGLLVLPAMTVVGGRLLWMARHEQTLVGEPQCEKFLIVRYPSHRRFLAMTLNPYYVAINELREAGVERFEASFTHASECDPELARRKQLVGVHFDGDALDEVVAAAESRGGQLVYATRATAALGILDPPHPTDPNPLSFGQVALFAAPDDGYDELAGALEAAAGPCAIHVYRREPRSTYRPSFGGR